MLLTLSIREVLPATPRARIVRLGLGGQSFPFEPGQAVLVADHGAEKRRPYSIAASPEEAQRDDRLELLVGVNEHGRAGAHLTIEAGTALDVEGPVGTFTFPRQPDARRFVFVAGGTGIAPLRAMLHRALALPSREIGVVYSARTPDEFAYQHELDALASRGEIELRQTVTRAADGWTGDRGRIGRRALQGLVHGPDTLCFVCGPPALVDDIPRLLEELGVPRARVRIEEW